LESTGFCDAYDLQVIWLLEAAERIAERVQAEVGEVVG
jgi:hypothetical protein